MYTPDRTEWWNQRSLDKAHQEAYCKIVQHVPTNGKRLLDIGCGTGEVLKRLWNSTKYNLYVGTDVTSDILDLAQANLSDLEIQAARASRVGWSLPKRSKRMVLVQDDLTKSEIPRGYADTVIFTFPEVFTEVDNPYDESQVILRAEMNVDVIKRAKIGGTVVMAEYDIKYLDTRREKFMTIDKLNLLRFMGLEPQEEEFVESEEIWEDTEGYPTKDEIPGYRIFKSVRLR